MPPALIQIPSQMRTELQLALDTGASISSVSSDLLTVWHKAEPTWPFMTGAVGAATCGAAQRKHEEGATPAQHSIGHYHVARRCGGALRTRPPQALRASRRHAHDWFGGRQRPRQYLVGIDYAHSVVYLQRTSVTSPPDMDGIGLTLRPELDGRYTVAGVVELDGKPSVPDVTSGDVLLAVDGAPVPGATMGQVWSLLGGSPGQTRP